MNTSQLSKHQVRLSSPAAAAFRGSEDWRPLGAQLRAVVLDDRAINLASPRPAVLRLGEVLPRWRAADECWRAGTVKARWVCEQAHQQLKEELGLDHFEGRSWTGLHRHTLMSMIAYAFLRDSRLQKARGGKKNPRPSATTKPASSSAGNHRLSRRTARPMSTLLQTAPARTA